LENLTRNSFRLALPLLITLSTLTFGCPDHISKEENAVIHKVLPTLKCPESRPAHGMLEFSLGRLEGGHGVAVITRPVDGTPEVLRVYWVKDDTVYAVNKAAAACAPELPDAPEEITVGNVLAVAK